MTEKQKQAQIIESAAQHLGVKDSRWLDALINFETAGTYSPAVKNPYSSARGLIQVIDKTARDVFNVSDSLSLVNMYPTFESQMENVVIPYLEQFAPFNTKQELYMAVFYPAYRFARPDKIFPEHVRTVNPGITTVKDYINFVDARIKPGALRIPKIMAPALMLAAGGLIAVYLWSKRK